MSNFEGFLFAKHDHDDMEALIAGHTPEAVVSEEPHGVIFRFKKDGKEAQSPRLAPFLAAACNSLLSEILGKAIELSRTNLNSIAKEAKGEVDAYLDFMAGVPLSGKSAGR